MSTPIFSLEEIVQQMIDTAVAAAVDPLRRELAEVKRELARMQGKANDLVKIDVASKILMCSPSQVRNYIAWGVIPEGKWQKLSDARNSPLVFELDHLNHLKANPQLLRRPA